MSEQNLLCNFRAQTLDDWKDWLWFKNQCKDQGLTICRPLIAFIRSYRKFVEGIDKPEVVNAFPVVVQLKQQNTFVYSVEKPRRTPDLSRYIKNIFVTTISKAMADAYVLQKAQRLYLEGQKTFCFKDFSELRHGRFRKMVQRLRSKDEITTVEPRTCPRFYTLMNPPENNEL